MRTTSRALTCAIPLLLSAPSFADVQLQFIEGAPKDRFIIKNIGNCDLGDAKLEIDFTESDAGLIFDVTGAGAGVEVFQPFEVTAGAQYLTSQPRVSDGDQRVTLSMNGLAQNDEVAFTIDVDDTNGARAITVADNELRGTLVALREGDITNSSIMDASAQIVIKSAPCDAS